LTVVLDTNVVSRILRGDPECLRKMRSMSPHSILLPQPVVAEIEYGIQRLPVSRKRRMLDDEFRGLLAVVRRLEWSDGVSRAFGKIKAELERKGQRIEDFDLAVAAHAIHSDSAVATGNVKHFERVPGLAIEDWGKG
jgi:tRNA(fMet)-specific endonuclease VapC